MTSGERRGEGGARGGKGVQGEGGQGEGGGGDFNEGWLEERNGGRDNNAELVSCLQ